MNDELTAEEELLAIGYQYTALMGVIEAVQRKLRLMEERAEVLQEKITKPADSKLL